MKNPDFTFVNIENIDTARIMPNFVTRNDKNLFIKNKDHLKNHDYEN